MTSLGDWLHELLDRGSFVPLRGSGSLGPAGPAGGWGAIDGRRVFVFGEGEAATASKGFTDIAVEVMESALASGSPVIGVRRSDGVSLEATVDTLGGYGRLLDQQVCCSGVIPQISIVRGRWVGCAAFSAGLADVTVVIERDSCIYMGVPRLVEAITGERVSELELGGADVHASVSGVASLFAGGRSEAAALVRYLMSFVPDNNMQSPPSYPPTDDPRRSCPELEALLPDSDTLPYDITDMISTIADDGEFFELGRAWSGNLVTGFARLDGRAVGIVASQPRVLAGTLDASASIKGARFVRFCDAFNIPLLVMLDVPGFLPGVSQEFGGIIRHGAKLVYALAQATVPRITLILRKAYGGAYIVMNSRHIRADLSLAWPTAQIAVMGAEGATRIIHRRELRAAEDPQQRGQELMAAYRDRYNNPYEAAATGYVDDVIPPAETRRRVIQAFEMLRTKRETPISKKHGNIPL